MDHLLSVVILLGSCCPVFASETPPPPANAARYSAKIKFLRVDGGKQTIAVDTEVTGTKGKPLKTALGGKDGLTLNLEIHDLAGSTPTQYLAQFKLTNGRQVLSEPALVTTADKPAKLMVGAEHGDRIEVDLIVKEGAAAKAQPPAAAPSSHGTSLMMMVDPRIIIQDKDDEEKLPAAP